MAALRIFITGGTFDKEYDEINGRLFFKDTHVTEMLRLGRCLLTTEARTLMMIDSLEMTDEDRALILHSCQTCPEDRIVITHGTDTMEQTALVLGHAFSSGLLAGKCIILTGAMVPYKFGSSDGMFNLGSSLAFVQALPPGIFVVMNGRRFAWNNVSKDKRTGEFRELS